MRIWCYNMNMSRLTNFNNKEGKEMSKFIEIKKLGLRLDTGEIIELEYSYAYEFQGNFSIVGKAGYEGVINLTGEEIVPVKYPKRQLMKLLGKYGNILKVKGNLVIVEKDNKYGLVSLSKMREIIPTEYEKETILEELDKFPT